MDPRDRNPGFAGSCRSPGCGLGRLDRILPEKEEDRTGKLIFPGMPGGGICGICMVAWDGADGSLVPKKEQNKGQESLDF